MKAENASDLKAEFDGYRFTAPSEKMAWRILFGLSGDFGCPREEQYSIVADGVAYTFDGDEAAWLEAVSDEAAWLEAVKASER